MQTEFARSQAKSGLLDCKQNEVCQIANKTEFARLQTKRSLRGSKFARSACGNNEVQVVLLRTDMNKQGFVRTYLKVRRSGHPIGYRAAASLYFMGSARIYESSLEVTSDSGNHKIK